MRCTGTVYLRSRRRAVEYIQPESVVLRVSDRLQPVWNATNGEIGNVVFREKYIIVNTRYYYVRRLFLYDRSSNIMSILTWCAYGATSFRLFK